LGFALGTVITTAVAVAAPLDRKDVEFFESKVRPILSAKCDRCHSAKAEKIRGGLLLDSRQGWSRGGDSGPAIVPGDPKKSLLIRAIGYQDPDLEMPPSGKLSQESIEILNDWIRRGAPDPREPSNSSTAGAQPRRIDIENGRNHWAFRRLQVVEPPKVKDAAWCRNPIDRFVLARLEAKGLTPNRPVTPNRFLRRLSLDLTGLPPTEAELDSFLQDDQPGRESRAVARLLADPSHGERWGRHWLDLARFAESHGFEHDTDRPTAYPYRDFVIDAINKDLPYDTFVRWQIAGDELAPENVQALRATGFLACGVHSTQITANQAEKERYDELDDIVATIGTSFLGLTIGCARCHDHKYDPIPQRDYYRMAANFTTTVRSEPILPDPISPKSSIASARRLIPSEMLASGVWTQPFGFYSTLAVAEFLRTRGPGTVRTLISTEGLPALRLNTQGPDFYESTYLLKRGDPNQKQEVAEAGFLGVLTRPGVGESNWRVPAPRAGGLSYRRRALADWITDVDQGAGTLLARVIVNRLWQHHFGRGLVATPSDFGTQAEPPTHPELLDWLAGKLIQEGWRLKPIHALIVESSTYHQEGRIDPAKLAIDPDNRFIWRQTSGRLEAEAIRDSMLAVSGVLDRRLFGPGTLDENQTRRSIYFTVKRSRLIPMMLLFDAPDALQGLAVRTSTTIAPQSLLLMNSPVVRHWALALADRLVVTEDTCDSPDAASLEIERLVVHAYRIALARDPATSDLEDAISFIESQRRGYEFEGKSHDARRLALADFCQALFALNEFIFND
jgi:hypothetical protein